MIRIALALALFAIPSLAAAADRSFIVGSFDRVRVDGPFAVTVVTGKSPAARASGSLDALDALTIRVNGDTLLVSMGAGNWTSDSGKMVVPPTITLATPSLRAATINSGATLAIDAMKGQTVSLALNGSGALSVGAIDADQFDATIVGTGRMTLAGKAARGRFTVSGPGSFDAGALIVSDLTARSDGPGELDLAARYTADVTTSGLGLVSVAGAPSCTIHAIAGGPVKCGKQGD
ncbi:DUF2807 domain-containing protein [Sphingomonas koreensis]|nr:DUF2807 domain-containing protein [Sphingomonas koreensis]